MEKLQMKMESKMNFLNMVGKAISLIIYDLTILIFK